MVEAAFGEVAARQGSEAGCVTIVTIKICKGGAAVSDGPPWHSRAALIDEPEHIDGKMSYSSRNDGLSGVKVSVKCQYGVNFCQFLSIGWPSLN